jgi:hypothetical protein
MREDLCACEHSRSCLRLVRWVALCAIALALAALAGLSTASPAGAYFQYFSGSLCSPCNAWWNGWNYYHYNWAFNSSDPNGPLVRVQEHRPNGTWVYTYSANGQIDICHGADYTETGCANISGGSISLTCYNWTQTC